ncbi:MAG: DUF2252 family protein [Planctomycetes bacterium]|nr:DUF2252 family protein [Planctomycetota bacterium]
MRPLFLLQARLFAVVLLAVSFAVPLRAQDAARDPVAAVRRESAGLSDADRRAKFEKLAGSPADFFRGTAPLFWEDLGRDPRLKTYGGVPDTRTWVVGDLHPDNFGSREDDRGRVVYGLNDFDAATVADYQLDVWRMAAGISLRARAAGLDREEEREAMEAFARAYREGLEDRRGKEHPRAEPLSADTASGPLRDFLLRVEKKKSRAAMLRQWTAKHGGERAFDAASGKLAAVDPTTRTAVGEGMRDYGKTLSGGLRWDPRYFHVKVVARRVGAGTGSLGADRFYVLVEGETDADDDDRILDVKRQTRPPADDVLPKSERATFANPALRAVLAEKALLRHADDHLGWMRVGDGFFSVRELSPYKDALSSDDLRGKKDFRRMSEAWGGILADAHAGADNDFDPKWVGHSLERGVAARLGKDRKGFDRLVASVGSEYADRVERDFQSFTAWRAAGGAGGGGGEGGRGAVENLEGAGEGGGGGSSRHR